MANTNSGPGGNENVVFSPTFLLPAAFPGKFEHKHHTHDSITLQL